MGNWLKWALKSNLLLTVSVTDAIITLTHALAILLISRHLFCFHHFRPVSLNTNFISLFYANQNAHKITFNNKILSSPNKLNVCLCSVTKKAHSFLFFTAPTSTGCVNIRPKHRKIHTRKVKKKNGKPNFSLVLPFPHPLVLALLLIYFFIFGTFLYFFLLPRYKLLIVQRCTMLFRH